MKNQWLIFKIKLMRCIKSLLSKGTCVSGNISNKLYKRNKTNHAFCCSSWLCQFLLYVFTDFPLNSKSFELIQIMCTTSSVLVELRTVNRMFCIEIVNWVFVLDAISKIIFKTSLINEYLVNKSKKFKNSVCHKFFLILPPNTIV